MCLLSLVGRGGGGGGGGVKMIRIGERVKGTGLGDG